MVDEKLAPSGRDEERARDESEIERMCVCASDGVWVPCVSVRERRARVGRSERARTEEREKERTRKSKEWERKGSERTRERRKIRDTSDHRHGDGQLLFALSRLNEREKERERERERERQDERELVHTTRGERRKRRASERVCRHVSVCVWRFLCACVQRRGTHREKEEERKDGGKIEMRETVAEKERVTRTSGRKKENREEGARSGRLSKWPRAQPTPRSPTPPHLHHLRRRDSYAAIFLHLVRARRAVRKPPGAMPSDIMVVDYRDSLVSRWW